MIQREQKQWRTEHPHVSVQTVYTDGHVPFGQLILINYLNSAFYTWKKKRKKNSYWNKHAKQPLTRRWNNRTIIYLLKTALDIHGKAKFSIKKNSPILLSFSPGNIIELVGSLSLEIENVRLFTAHATVALRRHFKEKRSTYVVFFFSNYTTAMR